MEIEFKSDDELAKLTAQELEDYLRGLGASSDQIRQEQQKAQGHLSRLAAKEKISRLSEAERADLLRAMAEAGESPPAQTISVAGIDSASKVGSV